MRYEGLPCEGCGKIFENNDDVVVCPQCGAPHHRECWTKESCCAHADGHADGYEWVFPKKEEPQEDKPEAARPVVSPDGDVIMLPNGEKTVFCPKCGAINYGNDMYCMSCRALLKDASETDADKNSVSVATDVTDGNGGSGNRKNSGTYNASSENQHNSRDDERYESFRRFGGIDPYSTIDGIPVIEYSDYVGGGKPGRIIRKISLMERFGKRTAWSWSGLFFGPIWLFFRKLKKEALIASGISIVFAVVCCLCSITQPYITYCKALSAAFTQFSQTVTSIDSSLTADEKTNLFNEAYTALIDTLKKQQNIYQYSELTPGENARSYIVSVCEYGITLGVPLYCAMAGLFDYRKKVKKDIYKIRTECTDVYTYKDTLIKQGGTSGLLAFAGVLVVAATFFTVMYLPFIIAVFVK